ncbi:MAG: precorrin-6A synthase (deacetylating) [Pseudomonadota bacterium]
MTELFLIGIGTGNPDHLTRQAVKALNAVDLVMIPKKSGKADLAELRHAILAEVVTNPAVQIAEFDLPVRDAANPDYQAGVNDWHQAIATVWAETLAAYTAQRVALLVWGDPSLYDSTLRIAARLENVSVTVVPGITSLQVLTAAHAIPLNDIGQSVTITTGRQLAEGWPAGAQTLAVMLDGNCTFETLDPEGISIWWGAYVGMPEQIILSGDLAEVSGEIIQTRAKARAAHGWIMDIYILRKS